jgi:hypothetical protein
MESPFPSVFGLLCEDESGPITQALLEFGDAVFDALPLDRQSEELSRAAQSLHRSGTNLHF